MSDDLPEWQFAYIQLCREVFGIGGMVDHLSTQLCDEVAGNPNAFGETQTVPRYLEAVITLKRGVSESDQGYEDLTHEVLHAAMPLQRQAVTRIIGLLPPKLHAHAWDLWTDANEPTVTRLARGLTPVLRATDRQK